MLLPFVALTTALLSTSALAQIHPDINDGSAVITSTVGSPYAPGVNVSFVDGVLEWDGPLTDSPYATQNTFSVDFGLMLEREAGRLEKRSGNHLRTRDGLRVEAESSLNKRGDIEGLEEHLNRYAKRGKKGKKSKKSKSKSKKKTTKKPAQAPKVNMAQGKTANSIITWYTGGDLQNPYCADGSGWTPTDSSMIAAVTLDWGPSRPACGSFWQLKAPGQNKAIVVRIVDMCAGCAPGSSHFDLTLKGFSKLYDLNKGKAYNINAMPLSGPPGGNWNTALYGPQNL